MEAEEVYEGGSFDGRFWGIDFWGSLGFAERS
jgi:hypothetical protein